MKGYKGFDKNLKCRDFQYEVGKTYKEEKAECCNAGFHFCTNPLDILNYYDLTQARFCVIEAIEEIDSNNYDDTKKSTTNIKIIRELTLTELIDESIKYSISQNKANLGNKSQLASYGNYSQLTSSGKKSQLASSGDSSKLASSGYGSQLASSGVYSQLASSGHNSKLASSGDFSKLASSGYGSQLASSGVYSQLASSGHNSKLASSGYNSQLASSGHDSQLASSGHGSQLASSGYYSKLASSGHNSKLVSSGHGSRLELNGINNVGANLGVNGIIKGKIGNWITLAEYDCKGIITCVKTAQIDGVKIKADTFYRLRNKKFEIVK